jgi:hypothetical protein
MNRVEVWNRFEDLEDWDRGRETENINISAEDILDYYETKKHKARIDERAKNYQI